MEVAPEALLGTSSFLLLEGFNPYSGGSSSRRMARSWVGKVCPVVSILILVEVAPEAENKTTSKMINKVSILILVEVAPEADWLVKP